MALQIADLYTQQSAFTAQNILTGQAKMVQTLEQIYKNYKTISPDERTKIFNEVLKNVLIDNKDYLAVWYNFELAYIDPQRRLPYGRERVVAFWNMGNIQIRIDSANLEGDIPGSAYFLMKSGLERTLLADPYFYSYTQDTGSSFLETSIGRGMYDGDKYIGAVGIDVSLSSFQKLLNQLRPFEKSKILIVSNNGTIIASENQADVGEKIDKAYPEFIKFKIKDKIKNGYDFSFFIEEEGSEKKYVSFYPISIEGSNMPWTLGFIISSDVITENIRKNSQLLLAFSFGALFIISLIIWLTLSMIVKPIEITTETLQAISRGNISKHLKIHYSGKDEIGTMAKAVNRLVDAFIQTQHFAQEIGRGNLDAEYQLLSYNDILGKSLIEMRNNLVKAKQEEQQREEENRRMSWLQNGITQINEILREFSISIETLSDEVIKFLVKYTEAIQGGFYLVEEKEGEEIISLKSAYAYDRKKEISAEIQVGEGLVGRAVKERRTVNIENLPEGYLMVRSGLGDKSPDNLVIVPLIFEENVLGAIELAGFHKFDEFKVDFLNQIAVRISSSVSVMLKNLETEKLLKESQLQTATFEIKEKQFVRSRKKIAQQQKEMKIKEQKLQATMEAIKKIGIYLELDTNKIITDTNDFLPKFFEVEKSEIIGKNIDEITEIVRGSKIWYEKFWEDVLKGNMRKKATIYFWKDKKIRISDIYFLIQDIDGNKISVVGVEQ
jgi:methyl-accepting chemotaxis protein